MDSGGSYVRPPHPLSTEGVPEIVADRPSLRGGLKLLEWTLTEDVAGVNVGHDGVIFSEFKPTVIRLSCELE